MNLVPTLKRRAPVIAFAIAIVCGWIASFVFNDLLPLCLGFLGGIIAGDLMEAVIRAPETLPRKRIGKPH